MALDRLSARSLVHFSISGFENKWLSFVRISRHFVRAISIRVTSDQSSKSNSSFLSVNWKISPPLPSSIYHGGEPASLPLSAEAEALFFGQYFLLFVIPFH
jgi:hypothetical protein